MVELAVAGPEGADARAGVEKRSGQPLLHLVFGRVGEPEATVGIEEEARGVAEFELAGAPEAGDEVTAPAELLYPLVAEVADEDVAFGVRLDRNGVFEFPLTGAFFAHLLREYVGSGPCLDPVVGGVGDPEVAAADRRVGNRGRFFQLAGFTPGRAEFRQHFPLGVELLDPVVGPL